MEHEQQVCSLDLAKRLKELGVKQESAFFWVAAPKIEAPGWHLYPQPKNWNADQYWHAEHCSAFTVAELGEMLWEAFEKNGWGLLYKSYGEVFNFKGTQRIGELGIINMMRRPDMGARMLIYLIENKLITV